MRKDTYVKKVKDLDLFLEHGIIDKAGFNSELLIIQRLRMSTILEESQEELAKAVKELI